jgi:hypothetical protein
MLLPFELLYCVAVGYVTDISEVYATSIFGVEMCKASVYSENTDLRVGVVISSGPKRAVDREICADGHVNDYPVRQKKKREICLSHVRLQSILAWILIAIPFVCTDTVLNLRSKLILLATCFTLVSYLAYSTTMKKVATCFSETSVDFQRVTLRYIPEDRILLRKRKWRKDRRQKPAHVTLLWTPGIVLHVHLGFFYI